MLNPEDDIEKIYRDFAKNYPLKTEDSGWDEFLQKMESAPVKSVPANKPGTGNPFYGTIKKYSYWLTAAALVAIITGVLFLKNINDNSGPPAAQRAPANVAATAPADKQLETPAKKGSDSQVGNKTVQQKAADTAIKSIVLKPQQFQTGNTTTNPSSQKKEDITLKREKDSAEIASGKNSNLLQKAAHPVVAKLTQKDNKTDNNTNKGAKEKPLAKDEMPANDNAVAKNSNNTIRQRAINETSIFNDKYQGIPKTTNADSLKNTGDKESILTGSAATADLQGQKSTTADTAKGGTTTLDNLANTQGGAVAANATPQKQTDKATTVQPMVKIKTSGNKYFYLGLVTGPDLSTVKFQQVKNTGFMAGLMLGVHLGNNISIESGLLYTAKKYYSSAAYFKINGLPPPDRDDLQSVNANGKFFEIPVTLKYNFINKKHYNVFLNGGFSSYFTSDEKYDLLFRRPFGNEVRSDDDDDLYANIFSIIHLSAGYEFKLNAGNVIRLEPYVKIPLAGLGAGSLPVTSGGLYISFTHSFFK